jgi:hypothetical protein
MTNLKLTRLAKKEIRDEFSSEVNIDEVFAKYVSIGYSEKRVADTIARIPSRNFLKNHKLFLKIYKILIYLVTIIFSLNVILTTNFNDHIIIAIWSAAAAFAIVQLLLIHINNIFGFILVVASYVQSMPRIIGELIKSEGDIGALIGLLFTVAQLAATVYILLKMYPFATFFTARAKVKDGKYAFLSESPRLP